MLKKYLNAEKRQKQLSQIKRVQERERERKREREKGNLESWDQLSKSFLAVTR